MKRWQVLKEQSGQSLQNFLKERLNVSGKQVKRFIDAGKCLLNGKSERFASRLVGTGDVVEIEASELAKKHTQDKKHIQDKLCILYIDEDIIAIDKPAGTISDSKTLLQNLELSYGPVILLHRLDKETTGILLFARNEKAAQAIEGQFKKRQIKKTYLALVDGIPKKPGGVVEDFLGKLHEYHGQAIWGVVSSEKGLYAKTVWEVKQKGSQASLLECHPETGRTHQIRVHLSGIGHPILGDAQYGRCFVCGYHPERILLHAAEIIFCHPRTKKMLTVKSPLPQDFRISLEVLQIV